MERNISLVSLLCFIIFNGCLVFEADAVESQRSEKLKLTHRHSPDLGHNPGTTLGPPKNSEERLKQLVQSDKARLHAIKRRLGVVGKLKDWVEFPFRSAADMGLGQYFVSLRMGTPAQTYTLLVDTGSCLTWFKCKYMCVDCSAVVEGQRYFSPNQSSSFKSIPCSSQECKTMDKASTLPNCPHPNAPCYYDYSYLDGLNVGGSYFNETVKFRFSNGQKKGLEMTMGCTDGLNQKHRFKTVDGILALGLNPISFAVKAAHEFGGKFSFCLENHWIIKSESSYLVFGAEDQVPNMQFTDLLTEESKRTSLYPVKVTGISVNGTMLDIPSYVWDMTDRGAGGMIVDSGTTVTHLVEQAFDKVIAAFEPSLSMYNKTKGNLDYCFNAPPAEEFDETRVPRLALHFEGGAKLEPAVNGYIFDDSKGVKCLGFSRLAWPEMNILGNLLMQNHLWEFDLANKKVGFARSKCMLD
ncbi:hypothetical protein Goshw_006213 [Gossypium schwendimanii]|uniref:Peptidase A1 domain-containing protein n=1 Tax=Gossypium schwendimanii TaxID=34291 RepID=A0A7J9LKN1_GOSSC|nr:hypothetical protein [Gossypium schwendimanii]